MKRKGQLYLDTIQRGMLDFDFEKVCCRPLVNVSLQNLNVYACLVCGRYFQGRSPGTPAHTHALECDHHIFIHLLHKTAWCLPEGDEVDDPSLHDIVYLLDPIFTPADIAALERSDLLSLTLDGKPYIPGIVGLNEISKNDSLNCVLLCLAHVKPVRDFFLLPANYASYVTSAVTRAFGEFVRKLWNRRNFKSQVSPHEILNAVSVASNKQFHIGRQADPVAFIGWLLHELHTSLLKKDEKRSVITRVMQGKVRIVTERTAAAAATEGGASVIVAPPAMVVARYLLLTLDLPPAPLFKADAEAANIIPQVPLMVLLEKFNGARWTELPLEQQRKRYSLLKLPQYLVFHVKRFTRNRFFVEKNSTIVTFPVRGLDMAPYLEGGVTGEHNYDLVSMVRHEGDAEGGRYVASVHSDVTGTWHDVRQLIVSDTHAHKLALCESCLLVYARTAARPAE